MKTTFVLGDLGDYARDAAPPVAGVGERDD
jgi:hypothetical protein